MREMGDRAEQIFQLALPALSRIGVWPRGFQEITGSYSSTVLQLQFGSSPPLILKVPRTIAKAVTETNVLFQLDHVPFTPSVVATIECGNRQAILMHKLPGVMLNVRLHRKLSLYVSLGQALATIHAQGASSSEVPNPSRNGEWLRNSLRAATHERLENCCNVVGIEWSGVKRVYEALWLQVSPDPTPRLAHTDFRTGNILIHGGALSAILDFESACIAPANIDILRISDELCGFESSKMKSFLTGYAGVLEIPSDLRSAELLYRIHHSIACIHWCLRNDSLYGGFFEKHRLYIDRVVGTLSA